MKSITIDIDGTALPVDGHQECAEKGIAPQKGGHAVFNQSQPFAMKPKPYWPNGRCPAIAIVQKISGLCCVPYWIVWLLPALP